MRRLSNKSWRHGATAFTLVELLVASIIFAVLTGAIYSVFASAMRLRERTFAAIEQELPSTAAIEIMRRDLSCMTVPTGYIQGAIIGTPNRMAGSASDDLDFFSAIGSFREQDTAAAGEIQEVHYYLQSPSSTDAPPGMELVREVYPFVLAETQQTPITQRLLNGIQSLQIDYYDGKQFTWADNWNSQTNESNTATNGDSTIGGTSGITGGTFLGNTSSQTTGVTTDANGNPIDNVPGVTPQAVKVRIDFTPPSRTEQPKRPVILVCMIPAQSKDSVTTETTTDDLSGVTGSTTGAVQ